MMALHSFERAVGSCRSYAAIRRLALAGLCLALGACGGSADAPPPPESVPTVTTQPADQSVVVGTDATFSVVADGAAPLAYQWSSSSDGVTFSTIDGASASSYTIAATTLAQSGMHFRVVISNSLGSVTSSPALLTVTPLTVAPIIVTPPADQSVIAPASATFNVTVTGTALTYQWQSSTDGGATFAVVAGAASAPTLTLTNTTVAQSGTRFRVVASNSAGSATSLSALLTVTAAPIAPAFTLQPAPQSIPAGQAASFTVAATGTPTPTLQWLMNGVALGNGVQASGLCAGATVAGATSTVLTLSVVPIACGGAVFSAMASNGVSPDATSNGALLTVTLAATAPVITLQPIDELVHVSFTASFTSTASGVPTPTVQWQQSTDGGGSWANVNGATGTTFTTAATVIGDNGKRFRAVFTNASGSATSNAALLTVTAASAGLNQPTGVAVDAAGNVYVADALNDVIVKISPLGIVSTLAGLAGSPGSADGNGAAARFNGPWQIDVDSAGNVYVSDRMNSAIRKITPAGDVSTLAGLPGSPGSADGTGSAARFNEPYGIRVDAAGNVYVGDTFNDTIRVITPAGAASTLAGSAGLLGLVDATGGNARFDAPFGLGLDAAGNIYVADELNQVIRVITPGGAVSTLAGTPHVPGNANGTGSSAQFNFPLALVVDAAGNVYVADQSETIRKITPAGVVTTFAGVVGTGGDIDGPGSGAEFRSPNGLAIDSAGNLYVADRDNRAIRKITPAGVVSTIAQ